MKIIIAIVTSLFLTNASAQTTAPTVLPTPMPTVAQTPAPEAAGPASISHAGALALGPVIEWGEKSQTFGLLVGGYTLLEIEEGEKSGLKWNGSMLKPVLVRYENETAAYGLF